MIIRQAKTSDVKSIQSLLRQLGYPDFQEQEVVEKIRSHEKPGYRILAAEIENQMVGFVSLHWFELFHAKGMLGRITALCIDESVRSQGIGLQLLRAGEKTLSQEGCVKFEVTSNVRRIRAHEFYIKSGYVEDSRRFIKHAL